jgi:hypothetical protein
VLWSEAQRRLLHQRISLTKNATLEFGTYLAIRGGFRLTAIKLAVTCRSLRELNQPRLASEVLECNPPHEFVYTQRGGFKRIDRSR